MSLFDSSFKELEQQLHNQEITVQDLVDTSYERINQVDDKIKAFLSLNEDEARQQAKDLDENGYDPAAKLFGLPAGIKDNIAVKGQPLTCASQILKNFNDPLYNATSIANLQNEQAVSIGKLNLDEFAMGSSNENSSFVPTRNPWDLERVPGGSSGGSAAAVAAQEVLFALGSDTGGSIRQPASFCGVVGMKPTYGRVSRYGLVAFASSLDQIGPITRRVEDNARVLEVIAGEDQMDSTSADVEVPSYFDNLDANVAGLKIAVPKEYLGEGVSQEVKDAVLSALRTYESMGATWEEVSLPHSKYAVSVYYLLASSEASANLARFDGVRYGVRSDNAEDMMDMFKKSRSEGFGDEVKRRIMLGTFALSSGYYDAYYKKAQQVRTLIKQDFETILNDYDVIIGPTAPTTAFKIGEKVDDPLTMYANDILTIPVNLAGNPALSIPAGFSDNSLPIGLQIIGRPFAEKTVYQTAYAYEQKTQHYLNKPHLGGGAS